MTIKSIVITFLDDEDVNQEIKATFIENKWTFNRPIYSRIANMTHDIWKIIKEQVKD